MTAKYMQSPIGPLPIDEATRQELAQLPDLELARKTLSGSTVWPEGIAELQQRGLAKHGMTANDIITGIVNRNDERKNNSAGGPAKASSTERRACAPVGGLSAAKNSRETN